jgi:galactokinase
MNQHRGEDTVAKAYRKTFGVSADLYLTAPGRVNLIGEHTDYNEGYVFPAAIDLRISGAFSRRNDDLVRLSSLDFKEAVEFSLTDIRYDKNDLWGNYPRGIALAMQNKGIALCGMQGIIKSEIPVGSGLSSSAALEMIIGRALLFIAKKRLSLSELAKLGQEAENSFVGVNCGIMDQFIVAKARKDHALLLDCRSLAYKHVPLRLGGYRLVVANTRKERTLAGSEYNKRRSECERALKILSKALGRDLAALRDVTSREFAEHGEKLPSLLRRRAEHVVYENGRVLDSVKLLRKEGRGWYDAFGKLMVESHNSLRDLYQVSCRELDVMVDLALNQAGVAGSRMTGAGFGGCTISLVKKSNLEEFVRRVGLGYRKATGLRAEFYVCGTSDGVKKLAKQR